MSVNYKAKKGTDAGGNTVQNVGSIAPLMARDVYFNYVSTQIYVGSVVQYAFGAGPTTNFLKGPGFDVNVAAGATGEDADKLAGVVVDLKETGGTEDGWITILPLIKGQIYTFAVAVGADNGDGLVLANSGAYFDDGGAFDRDSDCAIALYDEDSTENPHGTSAISTAIGLVDAIWQGGTGGL